MLNPDCIFCRIISGTIPCHRLLDTERLIAFLDINPLAPGHSLIIPKHHGARLTDIPDDYLTDVLPTAKKIANALGGCEFNLLQNNGRMAHQEVDHVHFHIIPKKSMKEGLGIRWDKIGQSQEELKAMADSMRTKLQ